MNRSKLVLAIFASTLSISAVGQTWPQRYDHEGGDDVARCIAVDKRGNVYVAGTVSTTTEGKNVLVASYTTSGAMRSGWPKEYNNTAFDGDELASAIHVDDDLNVYVAGTSQGDGTGYDFFVWKLNSSGGGVWPTSGGGTGYAFDSLGAFRTTSTDNEGFFSPDVKVDMAVREASSPSNRTIAITGTAVPSGVGGAFWRTIVLEQNSTGSSVSIKSGWPVNESFSLDSSDVPEAIAIYSDNTVYVTGRSQNPFSNSDPEDRYFTTIRYKASGTNNTDPKVWAHYWDSTKQSVGKDIVVDRDGNAYATGHLGILTDMDYGTVRIPKDWNGNGSDTGLKTATWDNGDNVDQAVSIDLTYEVSSGVIKPYIYVTGNSKPYLGASDIGTIRYSPHTSDQTLTNEWTEVYSSGSSYSDVARRVVGAGYGNAYVVGSSYVVANTSQDSLLLGYRRSSTDRFSAITYNGTGGGFDEAHAVVMAGAGLKRPTGESLGSGSDGLDFLTHKYTETPEKGNPYVYNLHMGSYYAGTLDDLKGDNDSYLSFDSDPNDRGPIGLVVDFEIESPVAASSRPSEICVRYDGKCTIANVKLKIELYDWLAGDYVEIDNRILPTTDAPVIAVIKDDPTRFMSGDGIIQVQFTYDDGAANSLMWKAKIDELSVDVLDP